MSTQYLAWRAPGQRWYPIGRLTRDASGYAFRYTRGALEAQREAGFRPLVAFPDLAECYRSPDLFPAFANRLPLEKPAELERLADCSGLGTDRENLLVLLARTMGRREADALEVFAVPEPAAGGVYLVHFFVHGLRHSTPEAIERAQQLAAGDRLIIRPESGNAADPLALMVLAPGGSLHLGYVPRFLVEDVRTLGVSLAKVEVARVNPRPAPAQFRVLCRLTAPWPEGFRPFASEAFRPIRGGDEEGQYLDEAEAQAHEASALFSERGRFQRERSVCLEALQMLGLMPRVDELKQGQDPPDVLFRDARFEVTALYDDGRRPHWEWQREAARRARASDVGDLLEPYHACDAVGLSAIENRLHDIVSAKCRELPPKPGKGYSPEERSELDLVVYVDRGRPPVLLQREPPRPELLVELERMGWRSVTLLTNLDCSVVVAGADAPAWLRERKGQVLVSTTEQREGLLRE